MKKRMKGIKYRMKDRVGPDPAKPNFQPTVSSVICDCKEKKEEGFLCNTFCFVTDIKEEKLMRKWDTE